jgi:hypothetical protein
MIPVKETPTTLEFKVLAVPRSSRNQIVGSHEAALKVKLKAPPVEGAANKMCLEFLAKTFQVPKSDLAITAGQNARRKAVMIRFSEDSRGKAERERVKSLLAGY